MLLIRNLLAIFGLIVLGVVLYAAIIIYPKVDQIKQIDSEAVNLYLDMFQKVIQTGDAAEATTWKVQVDEGLSTDEVEEVMKFVANEHNIKNVGELPLYKQVEAMSGKPYRFAKIYMFCNALTAAKMMDYSDAYSAYLPCRVSMVEDKSGRLWIYTLNMDMMIHGGKPLPPALDAEAKKVKATILDIMNRAAKGEF
jgi:uncharacterized protein (DUF302 family)